ncbi:MAG: hybrid sensor histidine kinase/response regulator [Alphaproteobacteria bacterium]
MAVNARAGWSQAGAQAAEGGPPAPAVDAPPSSLAEMGPPPRPRRFPLQVLMIAVPLTVMMLGLLAAATSYIWGSYSTLQRLQSVDLPLTTVSGEIAHESETMRMAVRAAAASGDATWETRYNESARRLDAALEKVQGLAPEVFVDEPARGTVAAERNLRSLERRVFALLREGRSEAARALVADNAYAARRTIRATAFGALVGVLERLAAATLGAQRNEAYRDTAVAAGAVAVLLVAWFIVLRMLAQSIGEAASSAAALERERDFAESLVENAQVIVLLLDNNGRIVRFNPYFAALSGYRLNNVRGRHWTDVFAPEDAPRRVSGEGEGERRGDVYPIVTRDGRTREIAWYDKMLRDNDDNVLGLLAIGQDITERNQAEVQRLAKEAAESANVAKSKFLAAASHDLRQPLQAMRMFISALARHVGDRKSNEIIGHIEDAVEATDSLLNALLDISKLDAGVLAPEARDFALGDLFDRLAHEFAPQAAAKGVELRVVATGVGVRSDSTLLEGILRNLLANAVRYTDAGRIVLGCRRRGDSLGIEVWDSGEGIPEDERDAIFEEFHQLGNPERDRTRGLGLGLAIVDRMSRLLGHRVTVASTPGKGSVFAVEVPRVAVPESPEVAEPAPENLSGKVVVIIDDEPRQLLGLKLVLEGWGCRVLHATTPEGALAQVGDGDGRRPDMIVADFRLRGNVSGAMAIERIRERVGARVPGLILTGDTEPARLREARVSGYELVHKPIEPGRLRAAMAAIVAPSPAALPNKG